MSERKQRERIPQTAVLEWLQANHPALHLAAEIDRDWIWLVVDLRGEDKKAIRESIKEFGFIFARRGGHTLPSGKVGTWGHSCSRPMPFKRRGHGARSGGKTAPTASKEEAQTSEDLSATDLEALAMILG